jgi:hypothetical protein
MSIETRRHYSATRLGYVAHAAIALAICLDAHAAYTLASTGGTFRLPAVGWKLDWGGVVGVALVSVFLYFRAGTAGLADKADNNRQYSLAGQIRRTNWMLSSISFLMLFSAIYMQGELANDRARAQSAPVKLAQAQYEEADAAYRDVVSRHGASANAAAAAEADGIRAQVAAWRDAAKAAFVAWLEQPAINAQGRASGKTIGQVLSQSCFVMSDDYRTLANIYAEDCKRHRAATRGEVDSETAARLASLDGSAAGARAIATAREERAHAERELLRAKAAGANGGEYFSLFALLHRLTDIHPDTLLTLFALLLSFGIVAVSSAAPGCARLVGETEQRGGAPRRPGIVAQFAAETLRNWQSRATARAHFVAPPQSAPQAPQPAPQRGPQAYRAWLAANPGASRADCARAHGVHPAQVTRALKG